MAGMFLRHRSFFASEARAGAGPAAVRPRAPRAARSEGKRAAPSAGEDEVPGESLRGLRIGMVPTRILDKMVILLESMIRGLADPGQGDGHHL
jgi:hypothetical protein